MYVYCISELTANDAKVCPVDRLHNAHIFVALDTTQCHKNTHPP